MSLHIVVDSSSDITPARAAELGITVVPLTIAFGDQSYRDGIDMTSREFYQRLLGSSTLPTTSMPTLPVFEETYRRLVQAGHDTILSVHLSEKFSGTFQTAMRAAQKVATETGARIEVIDSGNVSAALGLPVVRAATQARAGDDVTTIIATLRSAWERGRTFILLDTLSYLEKGGRIGRAQAFVGALLNIKPILTFQDGQVAPLERVRTRAKALARVGELLREMAPIADLGVVASDEATRAEMVTLARTVYQGEIEEFTFGPVVGTYAGPRSGGFFAVAAPRVS